MQNKPEIISVIGNERNGENKKYKFAYTETKGKRTTQEDALAWRVYELPKEQTLSPQQLGYRMWTLYHKLNDEKFNAGTTASTTLITKDHLVTATLGDAIAFAVIYDTDGRVVGANRLNQKILTPKEEEERIQQAGGRIQDKRIITEIHSLAVSRAIGDHGATGVCADAMIDITSMQQIPKQYKVQIITACDGLMEGLLYGDKQSQTAKDQEDHLVSFLNNINQGNPGQLSELEISERLVSAALNDNSEDNISVSVQTVNRESDELIMTGIYDGHGGNTASNYVASNVGKEFATLLAMSSEKYSNERYNASTDNAIYMRDNTEVIIPIKLIPIKLKQYYKHYNESETREHFFTAKSSLSNLRGDALKTDILHDIYTKIIDCRDEKTLNSTIAEFIQTDNYKILQTSQGIFSWLFSRKTSSLQAFDNMCTDKRKELQSQVEQSKQTECGKP